jgi:hypothetical protein
MLTVCLHESLLDVTKRWDGNSISLLPGRNIMVCKLQNLCNLSSMRRWTWRFCPNSTQESAPVAILLFYTSVHCKPVLKRFKPIFFTQEGTSHILRFYFDYRVMTPAAPQETVGEPGIEPRNCCVAQCCASSIDNVAIFYYRNLSFFCFRLTKNLTNVYFSL